MHTIDTICPLVKRIWERDPCSSWKEAKAIWNRSFSVLVIQRMLEKQGQDSSPDQRRNTAHMGPDLCVSVRQSCPTLHNSMDCSPPSFSVHGILLARILEEIALHFSRGSSWHRDQTRLFCTADRFFTIWATVETPGDRQEYSKAQHAEQGLQWPGKYL